MGGVGVDRLCLHNILCIQNQDTIDVVLNSKTRLYQEPSLSHNHDSRHSVEIESFIDSINSMI